MTDKPKAYLVWRRGMRGMTVSRDTMDPRSSIDWKLREPETIAIIPLGDQHDGMTLDQLATLFGPKDEPT